MILWACPKRLDTSPKSGLVIADHRKTTDNTCQTTPNPRRGAPAALYSSSPARNANLQVRAVARSREPGGSRYKEK